MAQPPSTVFFANSFRDEDRNKLVLRFIFCGTPVLQTPESALHWRIYLEIAGGRSVCLDMNPAVPSRLGVLEIDSKRYVVSRNSLSHFNIPPAREVTVGEVFGLLASTRRDRYEFDAFYGGCRFWCATVIGDLERAGIFPRGYCRAFEIFIEGWHAQNQDRYPLPIRMGRFY